MEMIDFSFSFFFSNAMFGQFDTYMMENLT